MDTPSFSSSAIGSVVALYWPSLRLDDVRQWATDHQYQATQLIGAANASELTYGPLFPELLQGRTGDALQTALAKNMNLWRSDAAEHQAATTALNSAADYLQGLQTDLESIVDHYQPLYEAATTNSNVAEEHGDIADAQFYANQAQGYVTTAESEAKAAADHAAARISSALNGKFGTAPAGFNQGRDGLGSANLGTAPTGPAGPGVGPVTPGPTGPGVGSVTPGPTGPAIGPVGPAAPCQQPPGGVLTSYQSQQGSNPMGGLVI